MILSPWRLIWCDLCGQSAKIRLPLPRINLNRNEKDYNSDSTVVLDRFARDKRKRTTTAERIERRPGPRRDADDTPREHAPRRASYNPPLHGRQPTRRRAPAPSVRRFQIWRRPAFGAFTGAVRTGPVRIVRAATAASVPRRKIVRVPTGRNPSVRRNTATSLPYGRKSAGKFGSERPYGEQEGDFRHGERAGAPKRYGPEVRGRIQRDDRRGEVRPKSYPRYNPNVQTGEIRLNRFIAQSGLCSRREADDYIQAGLVSVNGVIVTELGSEGEADRRGEVQRQPHRGGKRRSIWCSTSPKGCVTSLEDPHADKTVMDLVKGACEERIYPVGAARQEFGGAAALHQRRRHDAPVDAPVVPQEEDLSGVARQSRSRGPTWIVLRRGITLEDGEIHADEIAYVKGRTRARSASRSTRGATASCGASSSRWVTRCANSTASTTPAFTKKNLKRGAWRFLTKEEVMRLKKAASTNSAATVPVSNSSLSSRLRSFSLPPVSRSSSAWK